MKAMDGGGKENGFCGASQNPLLRHLLPGAYCRSIEPLTFVVTSSKSAGNGSPALPGALNGGQPLNNAGGSAMKAGSSILRA